MREAMVNVLAALKSVEYSRETIKGANTCAVCGVSEPSSHRPSCGIGKAIIIAKEALK